MTSLYPSLFIGLTAAATLISGSTKAEQFSVSCFWISNDAYVSLDTVSKRAVLETIAGRLMKGRITSSENDTISFFVEEGPNSPSPYEYVLSDARTKLRLLPMRDNPEDKSRGGPPSDCRSTDLRSALTDPNVWK